MKGSARGRYIGRQALGRLRRHVRGLSLSVFVTLVVVGFIEVAAVAIFKRPEWIPSNALVHALRAIYHSNRDVIQFNPECSRYDDELTYTLRPGVCTFSNVEFSVVYLVNSAGLRDDERSLDEPNLIVLGDSHSMGWGVPQESTYPQVVESLTGLRTLNAAISSYATPREAALFRRLDSSSLEALIVQYCPNDYRENKIYFESDGHILNMSREVYNGVSDDIAGSRGYYPGRLFARTLNIQVIRRIKRVFVGRARLPNPTGPQPRARSPEFEAEIFLYALRPIVSRGEFPIIVFEIDSYGRHDKDFIEAVTEGALETGLDQRIVALDIGRFLKTDHFFELDDHLNARGHKLVASKVDEALRRLEIVDDGVR